MDSNGFYILDCPCLAIDLVLEAQGMDIETYFIMVEIVREAKASRSNMIQYILFKRMFFCKKCGCYQFFSRFEMIVNKKRQSKTGGNHACFENTKLWFCNSTLNHKIFSEPPCNHHFFFRSSNEALKVLLIRCGVKYLCGQICGVILGGLVGIQHV